MENFEHSIAVIDPKACNKVISGGLAAYITENRNNRVCGLIFYMSLSLLCIELSSSLSNSYASMIEPIIVLDLCSCPCYRGELWKFAKAIKAFQAEGIEAIALKGVALLDTIYTDPGTREMSDIDLLVKPEFAERAQEIVRCPHDRRAGAPFRAGGDGLRARRRAQPRAGSLRGDPSGRHHLVRCLAISAQA